MRTHSLKHKLRYIVRNNKTGDSIGITLPKELLLGTRTLDHFLGVTFYISASGSTIILQSGCAFQQELSMKEINGLILKEKRILI